MIPINKTADVSYKIRLELSFQKRKLTECLVLVSPVCRFPNQNSLQDASSNMWLAREKKMKHTPLLSINSSVLQGERSQSLPVDLAKMKTSPADLTATIKL
jgi:hypothetical protein